MFATQGRPGCGARWFIEIEIRPVRGDTRATCSYTAPASPSSGPCTVCTTGVLTAPPIAAAGGPEWSLITSNSSARSKHESAWWISTWARPISALGAISYTNASFADVCESPDANNVTSWPASTRPSARSDTTHSIPP